jgi:hypothetical protein
MFEKISHRLNLNQSRIIIVLTLVLLIIFALYFVFQLVNNDSTPPSNSLYTERTNENSDLSNSALPTGIVLPTTAIKGNDIDIVDILPKDGAVDVSPNTNDEINFSSAPKINGDLVIDKNRLVITSSENLDPGTLYTFSVEFTNQKEKIRLYRFMTEGQPNPFLPSTREEEVVNEFENEQRINYPDLYIANKTPYNSDIFSARSVFDPDSSSGYVLIITSNINNRQQIETAVDIWLQSLNLSREQILELNIRYE